MNNKVGTIDDVDKYSRRIKKLRNRRVVLYGVDLDCGDGSTTCPVLATKKQLSRLKRIPVGGRVFLSRRYMYRGESCHVLRTQKGLLRIPWMSEPMEIQELERLYRL
jgi:hypothetical protein